MVLSASSYQVCERAAGEWLGTSPLALSPTGPLSTGLALVDVVKDWYSHVPWEVNSLPCWFWMPRSLCLLPERLLGLQLTCDSSRSSASESSPSSLSSGKPSPPPCFGPLNPDGVASIELREVTDIMDGATESGWRDALLLLENLNK